MHCKAAFRAVGSYLQQNPDVDTSDAHLLLTCNDTNKPKYFGAVQGRNNPGRNRRLGDIVNEPARAGSPVQGSRHSEELELTDQSSRSSHSQVSRVTNLPRKCLSK